MRRILILAAAAAATCLMTPAASAAPLQQDAMLRGAHLSPDTANVDVYLTAFSGGTTRLWLASVGYGDVSPYNWLKPGPYAVAMRPHGAAATTPPALTWTFTAKAGHAYTAAGVGMNKQLRGIIVEDELNPPAAGHGLVRVIQAASRAPHATITGQNGVVLAKSVAFATTTPYSTVSAGTSQLIAEADGQSLATTASVQITSGGVNSVVLLDGKNGGLEIRTLIDAAGATVRPIGSVPGGGGGTAHRPSGTDLTWIWAAGLSALAAGGLVTLARRRGATGTRVRP
jgi:Domain of unknown function (DUF4397)